MARLLILVGFIFSIHFVGVAQQDGFIEYKVESNKTVYSITKEYNVTMKQLYEANPGLAEEGLKANTTIKIPIESIQDDPKKEVNSPSPANISPSTSVLEIAPKLGKLLLQTQKANAINLKEGERIHVIKKGETFYSVSRRYNIAIDKVKVRNEINSDTINLGDQLIIPKRSMSAIDTSRTITYHESSFDSIIEHKVRRNQTLYAISKIYDISIQDIKTTNGLTSDKVKKGTKLKIVYKRAKITSDTTYTYTTNTNNDLPYGIRKTGKKNSYNVVVMLPLHLGVNASQMAKVKENETPKVHHLTKSALELYTGVMLAIDSMQQLGMSFNVNVYDTRNDTSAINKILKKNELLQADIIFGPIRSENVELVGEFGFKYGIQIINLVDEPSHLLINNPFITDPLTSSIRQTKELSNFVSSKYADANVILIKGRKNAEQTLSDVFEKQFKVDMRGKTSKFRDSVLLYPLDDRSTSRLKHFDHKLLKNKTNVIVLPSLNEGTVNSFFTQLNFLFYEKRGLKDYDYVLLGLEEWMHYQNLDIDFMNKFNVHIASSSHLNFEGWSTKRLIKSYRNKNKIDPNINSIRAFDIAFQQLAGLKYFGYQFPNYYSNIQIPLSETSFSFVQDNANCGFENNHVYILRFDNYEFKPVDTF